jgi:hypothetical protein
MMRALPAIFLVLGLSIGLIPYRAHAQSLLQCIQNAETDYNRQWADACYRLPEGKKSDTNCKLPLLIGAPLNNNLKTSRDLCFQMGTAGLLK